MAINIILKTSLLGRPEKYEKWEEERRETIGEKDESGQMKRTPKVYVYN